MITFFRNISCAQFLFSMQNIFLSLRIAISILWGVFELVLVILCWSITFPESMGHYKCKIMNLTVGWCRGYKRFFKRTALETSDYLKDDCLSVHCSVGLVRSHTEGPKIYSIAVPPCNIGQHFGQLLESGKGTDVNFEVDGETFSAHKLVLAARSPVFRAQLFGPMKDQNTQCIKVEDMEAPVFKVQLFYLFFFFSFCFCWSTYGPFFFFCFFCSLVALMAMHLLWTVFSCSIYGSFFFS